MFKFRCSFLSSCLSPIDDQVIPGRSSTVVKGQRYIPVTSGTKQGSIFGLDPWNLSFTALGDLSCPMRLVFLATQSNLSCLNLAR